MDKESFALIAFSGSSDEKKFRRARSRRLENARW
jgi:hypothetical protein